MLEKVQSAVRASKKEMLLKFITQYRELLKKKLEQYPNAVSLLFLFRNKRAQNKEHCITLRDVFESRMIGMYTQENQSLIIRYEVILLELF